MGKNRIYSLSELKKMLMSAAVDYACGLNEQQAELLVKYAEIIRGENENIHLTSFRSPDEIINELIIDSLSCLTVLPGGHLKILDLGSGAGIPGIPVKILRTDIYMALLESRRKVVFFLRRLVKGLGLSGIEVLYGRAEDLGREEKLRGGYDVVLSRAVASLPILLEVALPFLKQGGILVAQKGPGAEKELADSRNALKLLGGRLVEDKKYHSKGKSSDFHLLVIKKVRETPEKYPRRPGMPWKRPL
ncbi:MAG: 16S rRNA (guanine(527)-N(7))-methyltransferase RsmG [Candidatus Eremiobacteraeota bacterium]|nr:16S rRNA (guanine(527)-N(7))-methyltransferase RsmG [Candidatus Eremiobacteraeota bacterium]